MSPAKNICDCPNPPGGRAVCEVGQLAICRVVDGAAETECIDLPGGLSGTSLQNWLLTLITQHRRLPDAAITDRDLAVLRSGHYFDATRNMLVTFQFPTIRGVASAFAF